MTAGPVTAGRGLASANPAGAVRVRAGQAAADRAARIPAALTPGGAQAVFRATLDALARPGTVRRLPTAADEPLAAWVPAALLPLLALADLSTPACVVGDEASLAGEDGPRGTAGTGGAGGTAGRPDVEGAGAAWSWTTCPEVSARRAGPAHRDVPVSPDGRAGPASAKGAYDQIAWDGVVRVVTNAPRAALAQARLVTALRPLTGAELASLRTGSATAPEDGALACLAVAGIAIVEGAPPVSDRGASQGDAGPTADRTADSTSAAGAPSGPGDDQRRCGRRADETSDDAAAEGNGAGPSSDISHGTSAARALMTGHGDEQGRNESAVPVVGQNSATGAPRITGDDAGNDHAGPSAPTSGTGGTGGDNATAERTSAGPPAGPVGGKGDENGGPRLLLRLSGPGVPGTRAVIVTGLPAGFAAARGRLVAGFPAGADLLLIAPDGAMTGLPRTTVVHEGAC